MATSSLGGVFYYQQCFDRKTGVLLCRLYQGEGSIFSLPARDDFGRDTFKRLHKQGRTSVYFIHTFLTLFSMRFCLESGKREGERY